MEAVKELSAKNPATFIVALLVIAVFLGSAFWRAYEVNIEASILKNKNEFDAKQNESEKQKLDHERQELEADKLLRKNSIPSKPAASLNEDKEIKGLIDKYLSDFAGLDKTECGDDTAHNERLRQSKALLGRLDTLGKLRKNEEAKAFVQQQYQQGPMSSWVAKCK